LSEEFESEHYARMEHALQLFTNVRAWWVLCAALASKFPTEAEWENADVHPVIQEALDSLSTVIGDINRETEDTATLDPDNKIAISEQHFDRALESLIELGEFLEVAPEDILMVLMNG